VLGVGEQRGGLAEVAFPRLDDLPQLRAGGSASVWANMVRTSAATISAWPLGTVAEQVAHQMGVMPISA
jgi:hypothetical protein